MSYVFPATAGAVSSKAAASTAAATLSFILVISRSRATPQKLAPHQEPAGGRAVTWRATRPLPPTIRCDARTLALGSRGLVRGPGGRGAGARRLVSRVDMPRPGRRA